MEDAARVERVAKAIYEEAVRQARAQLEKLEVECADIIDLVKRLRLESETAQVLIFYSYLDDRIKHLLSLHLVGLDSNSSQEKLFGSNGPLGTFSNRIRMAYHLGWLSPEHWARLDAFRKVRNEFAHKAYKVTISDPVVADKLKVIDYDLHATLINTLPDVDLGQMNKLLPRLTMLAIATFYELAARPIAQAHRVDAASMLGSYEGRVKNLKQISTTMVRAMLIAGEVALGKDW